MAYRTPGDSHLILEEIRDCLQRLHETGILVREMTLVCDDLITTNREGTGVAHLLNEIKNMADALEHGNATERERLIGALVLHLSALTQLLRQTNDRLSNLVREGEHLAGEDSRDNTAHSGSYTGRKK